MKKYKRFLPRPGDVSIQADYDSQIANDCHWNTISIGTENINGFKGLVEVEQLIYPQDGKQSKKQKLLSFQPASNECLSEMRVNNYTKKTKARITLDDTEALWNEFDDLKSSLNGWDLSNSHPVHPAILSALKISNLTSPLPIQKACFLPAYRDKKDIIGVAETGSGKTLAFAIPILCSILRTIKMECEIFTNHGPEQHKLRAIIISPTRELTLQLFKHIGDISRFTPILTIAIIGGLYSKKQIRLIEKGPEIIVCTPGRLNAFINGSETLSTKGLEYLNNLSALRFLVLDEADRLLLEGAFNDLSAIMSHIYSKIPTIENLQTFIFSATLSVPQNIKTKRGQKFLSNTIIERLISKVKLRLKETFVSDLTSESKLREDSEETTQLLIKNKISSTSTSLKLPDGLDITLIKCQNSQKEFELICFLFYYLQKHPQVPTKILIFVNTISYIYRLVPLLSMLFYHDKHNKDLPKKLRISQSFAYTPQCAVYGIHSSMSQKQRLKNLEKFRDNNRAIFVSTDVAARGLDIPDINVVVHLQIPRNSSIFVHRSGRTARANKSGLCVTLSSAPEFKRLEKLLATIGISLRNLNPPNGFDTLSRKYMEAIKQIYSLASQIEREEHNITKSNAEHSWIKKYAVQGELDLESEGDSDYQEQSRVSKDKAKEKLRKRKAHLIKMLSDKEVCFQ